MKFLCGLCLADGKNVELCGVSEINNHFEEVHKQGQEKEILRFVSGLQILKD